MNRGNLVGAVVVGIIVALICATIWGTISVVAGVQIGWLAIGVGFAVGVAVRVVGKGTTPAYGCLGGALSLLAVVLGNFLSIAGFLARHSVENIGEQISFTNALSMMLSNPSLSVELMKATFSPMDLLFYGLALYVGFQSAFTRQHG